MTHDEIRALATAAKARADAAQRSHDDETVHAIESLIIAMQSVADAPALADAVLGLLDEIDAVDLHHDSEIRHWADVTGCPPGVTLADHLVSLGGFSDMAAKVALTLVARDIRALGPRLVAKVCGRCDGARRVCAMHGMFGVGNYCEACTRTPPQHSAIVDCPVCKDHSGVSRGAVLALEEVQM